MVEDPTNPYAPPTATTSGAPIVARERRSPWLAALRWGLLPLVLYLTAVLPFVITVVIVGTLDDVLLDLPSNAGVLAAAVSTAVGAVAWMWLGCLIAPSRHRYVVLGLFVLGALVVTLATVTVVLGSEKPSFWLIPLLSVPAGAGTARAILRGKLPGFGSSGPAASAHLGRDELGE